MRRRGPVAAGVLSGVLVVGVLAGCGGGDADPRDAVGDSLDVSLDGFHLVAERPGPETLCDPDPADPYTPPPALPTGLGSLEGSVQLASAPTTVGAYAWTADDADRARALVAAATAAATACTWTSQLDGDGDGVPETPPAQVQQVEEWAAGDWAGLRILHTVTGVELVDRRLVAHGEVVLLVVTRADGEDPALLTAADDYLAAVAERLG